MRDLYVVDTVRLEVEADPDPGQLVNLVENPSGEMGGYGYITPVPGSVLLAEASEYTDYRLGLVYSTANNDGGNYLYYQPVPMEAGQYVAASWFMRYSPYGVWTGRFSFLDANGSTISQSPLTTWSAGNQQECNLAPVQAPAGTVSVRWSLGIRYNATTQLTWAGAKASFWELTIAVADTAAELATLRHNLQPNPAFNGTTTGWAAAGNTTAIAAVLSPDDFTSAYACRATPTPDKPRRSYVLGPTIPVTAGTSYAAQARMRTDTGGTDYGLMFRWYDKHGDMMATSTFTVPVTTPAASVVVSGVAEAPIGARTVALSPFLHEPDGAWYVSEVMLEHTDTVGSYFDGGRPSVDGWEFAWDGDPDSSSSTATNSNLGYVQPVSYINILGSLHDLKSVREELNVGTLTATVLAPELDPSTDATLRPGRRFRLTAENGAAGHEPLIVGKLTNAKVAYDPLNPREDRRSTITLTGYDPVSALASAKRKTTVATIAELPYVLEGAGVPWNCDGSGNQVAAADVVVSNDNATALDQVAITRDTVNGYAWVDRYGTLQAHSGLPIPGQELTPWGDFTATTDPSKWWINGGGTLARSTTIPDQDGATSGIGTITATGTTAMIYLLTGIDLSTFQADLEVIPGADYTLNLYERAEATPRRTSAVIVFSDADRQVIGTTAADVDGNYAPTTTAWQQRTVQATAPSNARYAAVRYSIIADDLDLGDVVDSGTPIPSGEKHYIAHLSLQATTATAAADESVYNPNLSIDYDTDRCINSVTVRRQWTDATGQAQESVYGPYADAASVSEWGTHAAEVTVAGTTPSAIPGYAQTILDANATPAVRINQIQIPISSQTLSYAFLDLYDLVQITNAETGVSTLARITGITHEITADDNFDQWLMTLDFAAAGAVATPTAPPAVTSQSTLDDPMLFMRKNSSDMTLTANTWTEVTGWDVSTIQGLDQIYSRVTISQPGLYLVQFNAAFSPDTSRCLAAITLNDTSGGSPLARFDQSPSSSARVAANLNVPVLCKPGDVIRGLVYVASANRKVEASVTTMSVVRIK